MRRNQRRARGGSDEGNTTFSIALAGSAIGGKTLNAIGYSVYATAPSDLATFTPSAATSCGTSGSGVNLTVNAGCLAHAGSPTYATGSAGPANDVTFFINGTNTTFNANVSLGNGSGYVLAVGAVTTDASAYCWGYSSPFTFAQGMKTTVALTVACIQSGTTKGFANINTTTTYVQQPSITNFVTGPMSVTFAGGTTSGQVSFQVNASDNGTDYMNYHFSPVAVGTWSSQSGTTDNVHDCNQTNAPPGSMGACQLYYNCPSTGSPPTVQDISVMVFNTATAETAGSINSPAPLSSVTLDFGNVTCS